MTIATLPYLVDRFGSRLLLQLADRDNTGQIDEGVVEAALQEADGEIVGLLNGVVAIDAANPPIVLKAKAADIALYKLYSTSAPEDVRTRYEDALKFLRAVAKKEASLDGGAAAPTVTTQPLQAAASETPPRLFKRGL